MVSSKAQAAIEYSMVVFISLILISGFTYYFFEQKTSYEDDTVQSRIDNIGMKVSEFAEEAKYSTGPYRKTFRVNIPEGVQRMYVHDGKYIVFETYDGNTFVYQSRNSVFGYIEEDKIHSGKVVVEKVNESAVICGSSPCKCMDNEIGYCDDKADNDCDGYVDGADTDCCDDIDGDGYTGIELSGTPSYCALGSFAKDCNDTNSSFYPGTSFVCAYDDSCNVISDDPSCGVIECSGWYNWTGTQGVTASQNCYYKDNLTSNRCESAGNCKDSNSTDCESQPGILNYTCGICQYIASGDCDGTVEGSCSYYDPSNVCSPNAHCDGAGTCVCDAGYDDCDGSATDSDGCESDLSSDNNNCGVCANSCGSNAHCSGGSCTCDAGYITCDGAENDADGCEVDPSSDDTNCGSCGNNCNVNDGWYCTGTTSREYRDYYCSGGSCTYSVTSNDDCNTNDGCSGDSYRDYYCSAGSCAYNADDCSDCSCNCGNYNAIEGSYCSDGKDNDCDGDTDNADSECCTSNGGSCSSNSDCCSGNCYDDNDGDRHDGGGSRICHAASRLGSYGDDCNDGDSSIHPGVSDVCDGVNNDCDGSTDEDASCGSHASCSGGSCVCDANYDDCDGDGSCECNTISTTFESTCSCDLSSGVCFGHKQPMGTEYCDGEKTECSSWGTCRTVNTIVNRGGCLAPSCETDGNTCTEYCSDWFDGDGDYTCESGNVPDGTGCAGGDGTCDGGVCKECSSDCDCNTGSSSSAGACDKGDPSHWQCDTITCSEAGLECGTYNVACELTDCGSCGTDQTCSGGICYDDCPPYDHGDCDCLAGTRYCCDDGSAVDSGTC